MIRVALIATGVLGYSLPAQAQSFETEITSRAIERPMDLVNVKLIRARSINPVVQAQIEGLDATAEEAMRLVTLEALNAGNIEVTMKTMKAVSLIDEHTVSVKVGYDPRPVGGILTIRVSMTPSFRGIGISTRPTVSRSVALAVDELTESFVKSIVSDLTEEIKAEFARVEQSVSGVEVDGE